MGESSLAGSNKWNVKLWKEPNEWKKMSMSLLQTEIKQ